MAEQDTKAKKDAADSSAKGKKPAAAKTDGVDSSSDGKKKKSDTVNTQTIPIMITLAAAAISCIMSLMQHVELGEYVGRLVITVIIFGAIGIVVRVVLDRWFLNPKVKKEDEEDAAAAEEKAAEEDSPAEEDADEDRPSDEDEDEG